MDEELREQVQKLLLQVSLLDKEIEKLYNELKLIR